MAHEVLVHEDRVKEYLSSLDDENEEAMDGPNNLFRVRSGDHRGLYQILDQDKEVHVWDFDRKEKFERRYNID